MCNTSTYVITTAAIMLADSDYANYYTGNNKIYTGDSRQIVLVSANSNNNNNNATTGTIDTSYSNITTILPILDI